MYLSFSLCFILFLLDHESLQDAFPFSGGITTMEILASGVPIVTLITNDLRGLMGGHMYRAMGYIDLIANNLDEYIKLAGRLIRSASLRAHAQRRIMQGMRRLSENRESVFEWERMLLWMAREKGLLPTMEQIEQMPVPGVDSTSFGTEELKTDGLDVENRGLAEQSNTHQLESHLPIASPSEPPLATTTSASQTSASSIVSPSPPASAHHDEL
jgi:hypothetical protein